MRTLVCARALLVAAVGGGVACSAPATPTPAPPDNRAVIAIIGLTATAEPLTTTSQPGLLYRLRYQVRESVGRTGATLLEQHFVFSNGSVADGTFNPAAHVAPASTITIESTYSVYPANVAASRVTFSISYMDDRGLTGTAIAEADVSRIGS
jgi:hypothetical protein